MVKWLKKIINSLFKTKLTTTQFRLLREIYRRKSCVHCGFLVAYVNWWCSNNDACKARGTKIPGICHCPRWKPNKKFIKLDIKNKS